MFKPILENLKDQELLLLCNSPSNTPILGVKMPNDKWKVVQDLWRVSETGVPLYTMVPNPYTLLYEIPEAANYFSVIDLKDVF